MSNQSVRSQAVCFVLVVLAALVSNVVLPAASNAQALSTADFVARGSADARASLVRTGVEFGVGVLSLGWAIADTVSFAANTPFAVGWAVGDFVVGSASLFLGIDLLFLSEQDTARKALGITALAAGAYQIGHGIWSLIEGAQRGRRPSAMGFSISPIADGGAMISYSGRF